MRVLISAPYFITVAESFRPIFDQAGLEIVVAEVDERLSEAELMEFAGEVDAVIAGDDRFTKAVLMNCSPRLKVISKWGTGIDSIDLAAAETLGVKVYNTPGAFTQPVADSVLAYMLAFARRLPWMDAGMKAGRWTKLPSIALHECTLGVVGVGQIGKAVLQRAKSFGMTLLGNDILQPDAGTINSLGVSMLSLQEVLREF